VPRANLLYSPRNKILATSLLIEAMLYEEQTRRGVSLAHYDAFGDVSDHCTVCHKCEPACPVDIDFGDVSVAMRNLLRRAGKRRISVGLKQLQPHPWELVNEKYKAGDRVKGVVTRVADFGAFVELEKGVEGLIHLSEMSWSKKIRKASDVVNPGDQVEVVVLGVNQGERRISLGLKQALGDPWADAQQKYPVGAVVEAPVVSLTKFGAFVQLAEGVEGMIHVGDISAEKRINHPQDELKVGQVVKAQVLELDLQKRRLRLGMKQLIPTSLDEYIAEHKEGDVVTGRMTEISSGRARVELGEGVFGVCRTKEVEKQTPEEEPKSTDLSSLTSMLQAKWKGGRGGEQARSGQIRSFRIVKLDPASKKIELEVA
jgi:small subunit ribosomal protein S1